MFKYLTFLLILTIHVLTDSSIIFQELNRLILNCILFDVLARKFIKTRQGVALYTHIEGLKSQIQVTSIQLQIIYNQRDQKIIDF